MAVLILRIKQAEKALADGRLAEALDLATQPQVRAHQRGQTLLSRLLGALVQRGGEHLEAGRLADAHADAERAGRIDRHHADVAALRQAIADATADRQQRRRERDAALANARRCLDEQWLSGGAHALAGLESDCVERREVEQAMAMERARTRSMLQRAEAAADAEDWAGAADLLGALGRHRLGDPEVAGLTARVVREGLAAVESAWEVGRLAAAKAALEAIRPIARATQTTGMESALGDAADAWTDLAGGEPARACRTLRRLKAEHPEARWLEQAVAAAEEAARAADAVAATPLAKLADLPPRTPDATDRGAGDELMAMGRPGEGGRGEGGASPAASVVSAAAAEGPLAERFVLQVDGVGAFLVVRSSEVRVGPASGALPADIGLVADPNTPAMTIRRAEEDYFVSGEEGVRVNGGRTRESLLGDGDRLALSRHVQLRFRQPHAASTTAVLEVTAGRLLRADVRQCVLLDREIVIGPGSTAHIPAPHLPEPIVLRLQGEQLVADALPQGLPAGVAVRLGGLQMRLQAI